MDHLWRLGYAAEDILKNTFKVCKNLDVDERLKLAFIKVSSLIYFILILIFFDSLCC